VIVIAIVLVHWSIAAAVVLSTEPLIGKVCGQFPRRCWLEYVLNDAFGPIRGKFVLGLIWFEAGILWGAIIIWVSRQQLRGHKRDDC
jgi:hypothetical protein